MPSAFAHAFVGASLASLLPKPGRPRLFVAALAALAAAPDLDVVAFRFGIPYEHPLGHRGLTHSLFFAAAVALLCHPLWRRRVRAKAGISSLLTFLALASHGLLDAFTDAGLGIGLWIPLDDGRYFFPWRPVRTSPLSAGAFFSGAGLGILANEATWVGMPTLALLGVAALARRTGAHRTD